MKEVTFLKMKKIAPPILEISSVCKKEKNKILDRLSLIVTSGESVAVLYKNENNIELLCDILKGRKTPDKGKIFFKSKNNTGVKNSFGVVERKPEIPKIRSVADFAAHSIVKRGLPSRMAAVLVQKEAEAFGLTEFCDKTAYSLPKNLALRAEVFAAYMCSHELMVIDEPFGTLDQKEKEQELQIFEQIKNSSGLSLLLFTQDINIAIRFCDSVAVVDSKTECMGIISVDRKKPEKTLLKIKEIYNSI